MKKYSIPRLLPLLIFIAIHLFPITVSSQHRIPKEGENIQFYPIVDALRVIHTGYDCFYSEDLVCLEGGYIDFKNKYRFKKGKNKLTPLAEIEDYTFFVRAIRDFTSNSGKELLIFLTRNEDGEKVILRLKLDNSRGNNLLTNTMFEYKRIFNGWGYVDVIDKVSIPYINEDSLRNYKTSCLNNIIFYANHKFYADDKIKREITDLVELINKNRHTFYNESTYELVDIEFMEVLEKTSRKIPCARLRGPLGDLICLPLLCYLNNNEDANKAIYPLSAFFVTEDKYRKIELSEFDLQPLIDEYVGKDVYYGLDNTLTDENQKHVKITTAANINEVYKLAAGHYKSIDFVVNSDIEKGLLARETVKKYPYAILEDSLGIRFKVRINDEDYKDNKKNCFEKYFTHANIADSIIAERERVKFENALRQMKRLMDLENEFGKDTGFLLFGCSDEEVDRFRGLKKEFGEKYGLYLIKRSDEDVDRFRRLKKKYGAINAIAILGKGYAIGWTEDMIRESLGIPYDINRSVGSWGVHEQWIYRMDYETIYIYFENGKVRSFQD